MNKEKTRHLPIYDFLEVLQSEYIQAELRRKIYRKDKDKKYYQRVMDKKKIKIEDLANRNGLPSIFTSKEKLEKVKDALYNHGETYPKFFYKDDVERLELEFKDFINYYSRGSEVKVLVDKDEVKVGKIHISPQKDSGSISIKLRGEEDPKLVLIDYVTRIL